MGRQRVLNGDGVENHAGAGWSEGVLGAVRSDGEGFWVVKTISGGEEVKGRKSLSRLRVVKYLDLVMEVG